MNAQQKSGFEDIVSKFGIVELKRLLELSGCKQTGRKTELVGRVMGMFNRTKVPVHFNHQLFLTNIIGIHMLMEQNVVHNHFQRNESQHERLIQVCSEQIKKEGDLENCNIAENYSTQLDIQPIASQSMPIKQKLSVEAPLGQVVYMTEMNKTDVNANCVAPESTNNFTFNKLPFYVVVNKSEVGILNGGEETSFPYYLKSMRQSFRLSMSTQQVKYISMHQNEYKVQIRIGLLNPGSTEVTDFLPNGLQIQISSVKCEVPSLSTANTSPALAARRIFKPIDCTSCLLRLDLSIQNTITFRWVPDQKTYVWGIFLVKKLNTSALVKDISNKGMIKSGETINSIIKQFSHYDTDLAVTSIRITLMCPLDKKRMMVPTKSIKCDHLKCFDAIAFISMNEQKPSWSCPICNIKIPYEDLRIDKYFFKILHNSSLPDSCEEIEVMADGTWKVYVEPVLSFDSITTEFAPKSSGNSKAPLVDLTLIDGIVDGKFSRKKRYKIKLEPRK